MPVNRIDATVAPEQHQAVLAALETIAANLPFLIDLTAEERREMPKFGDKTRAFVAKAATIAEQNPDILPRSFDFAEMKADVDLIEALYPVLTAVTKLAGRLEDTYFAAGSEAYAGALLVYQYAKAAHLATGALEDALDDLGRRFARRNRKASGEAEGA